jgi:hypothetical protein
MFSEDLESLLPSKPGDLPPIVDDDLTELSDRDLMILFGELVAWANYLSVTLASAEIAEKEKQNELEYAEAQAFVDTWGTGKKGDAVVTYGKAQQRINPISADLRSTLHEAYAHRKMLSAVYSSVDRNSGLVSRELTRRLGRDPYERRTNA